MLRVRKSLLGALGAFVVLAALWGCNGSDIDDPTFSDSVLIVDQVDPASLQADVSPDADPNGVLPPSPPADDVVTLKVRNLNRTQGDSGVFGDIHITSVSMSCTDPTLNSLLAPSTPASLTIPAEASASVNVLVFPGPFKAAISGFLLGLGTDLCTVSLGGFDLGGEAVLSTEAVFGVSFVDTP